MPTNERERIGLLKKAGLVALVEGVKAIPGVGSLVVAGVAGTGAFLQETIAAPELPEQAHDALQQLVEDYRQMLAAEAEKHPDDNTLEVALVATLEILTTQGLSAEELVAEAGLDTTQAARLTLQRAEKALTSLYDNKGTGADATAGGGLLSPSPQP